MFNSESTRWNGFHSKCLGITPIQAELTTICENVALYIWISRKNVIHGVFGINRTHTMRCQRVFYYASEGSGDFDFKDKHFDPERILFDVPNILACWRQLILTKTVKVTPQINVIVEISPVVRSEPRLQQETLIGNVLIGRSYSSVRRRCQAVNPKSQDLGRRRL